MFTGIISDVGEVVATERRGDLRARIATAYDPATIALGRTLQYHMLNLMQLNVLSSLY